SERAVLRDVAAADWRAARPRGQRPRGGAGSPDGALCGRVNRDSLTLYMGRRRQDRDPAERVQVQQVPIAARDDVGAPITATSRNSEQVYNRARRRRRKENPG